MRRLLGLTAAATLTIGLVAAPAAAAGPRNTQMADRGWTCIPAGPSDLVHCFPPGFAGSDRTISVKVFDTTNVEADGDFLGTELLIHDTVFAGQPCPQDDGSYEPVPGMPYWACHHYER